MIIKAVWDYRITEKLITTDKLEYDINNLLDTIECAKMDNADIYFCDELLCKNINGIDFSTWLYDKNSYPEYADAKRELYRYMMKSNRVGNDEYFRLWSLFENNSIEVEENTKSLVISFYISADNTLYVFSPQRYYSAKQWYLSKYVNRDEFVVEAKGCFLNLFFHENVISSINTLNTDFRIVKPYIIEHLQALDAYQRIYSLKGNSSGSFREIANEIEELYSIACSPQADRNSVKNLKYDFKNNSTKRIENLCCELHTKLKWHDMDRSKQDRIYFHPGKLEIENGRILIVHIGTHL